MNATRAARRFGFVAALVVAQVAARAEAPPPPPVNDHIGHTRHHHRHNPPHGTTSDPARFVTSREGAPLQLPLEEDAFFFVVFGDRTGGPVDGVAVLADAVRDVNLLEPDLVMTVGDLVQGYTDESRWLEQMREYQAIMDQLLCPWFPVVGNHDVYWRGPEGQRPARENETLYEMHFGPLWYAFEHKNCWFIALFSDEGNPDTGEKNFNKPECQRMSPEQFAWLEETLKKASNADHVFCFLHHPRWLRGGYGDDWDRVHELLVKAGNVSAVFAGHIHHMHYDQRDGIEYVTLATTGGHQGGVVPSAGFLHQFHLVTVRKKQLAIAALPVGEVIDPRDITGPMQQECVALSRQNPKLEANLHLADDGAGSGLVRASWTNTSSRPIEITVFGESRDGRWSIYPDHLHKTVAPGATQTFELELVRPGGSLDASYWPVDLVAHVEYLTASHRYPLPERRWDIPVDVRLPMPDRPAVEMALALDGADDYVPVGAQSITLPDGPLTLECWFRADGYGERVGLVSKMQSSDYGIFVSEGRPSFSVFLGAGYVEATGREKSLAIGKWHHVAGVYDGQEVRVYVDGVLQGRKQGSGARRVNDQPLVIGADVESGARATSHFDGLIDEVRLSDTARYAGESFEPQRRFEPDERTRLLLHMDGMVGPWLLDSSAKTLRVEPRNGPRLAPADATPSDAGTLSSSTSP